MGFGASIFLIALGAIFAFAIEFDLGWIDIAVVGWVLILAGLVGLITTVWFWQSRRRPVATTADGHIPAPPHPASAPPQTHVAPPVAAPVEDRVVEEQYRVRRQQPM
ncbi:DUF6458 family protein [Catenuloplanes atrovinosus]|uniref:DUF6458 domain-containing protein n=1 Tax=Catenuloplanes atrovinosus TaxID=137266 RepID=A0AAE4CD93_9ACTN|nr:DUF6458 family protein [Catenuloplanes atrovinosus]MDR7280137.1 hypothetical protein [Catenuloplanes atrovinosus]